MNVTIWDLDWYENCSQVPNVDCMKLSSYHKQRGDSINFVTNKTQLGLSFDLMYIARESDQTEVPSKRLINDSRVRLLGKGFKYYGAKGISSVVAACRPDYLLYEIDEHNPYANANFVQFYCGKTRLKTKQDYHSSFKYHKKTVVVDSWFWRAENPDIICCLEELKHEKNIAFLKPISLFKILSNIEIREKFLALHFAPGTVFTWNNDLQLDRITNAREIIKLLRQLHAITKSQLGTVPFMVELTGGDDDMATVAECFLIIDLFKQHKFCCNFKFAGTSTFKTLCNCIENWTQYDLQLSFVEYVTHLQSYFEGLAWYEIVNQSEKWHARYIDWLLYLLTSSVWENVRPCLFRQWGENYVDAREVNYITIKPNLNLLFSGDE